MSVSQRLAGYPAPREAAGMRLPMSYDDYLVWAEGSVFAEWKDGEVIVHMPVKDRHQRVVELLYLVLGLLIRRQKLGLLRLAPYEAQLWPGGPSREPDLLFVAVAHLDRLSEDRFVGGPDLIVEVVSDDSVGRDYREKREEYRAAGVREYWIIDPRPHRRSAEFYRLDSDGQYRLVGPDAEGVIHSEVIPGFWWRMAWLWMDPEPEPDSLLDMIGAG